jgi:hypothetical protein
VGSSIVGQEAEHFLREKLRGLLLGHAHVWLSCGVSHNILKKLLIFKPLFGFPGNLELIVMRVSSLPI